MRKPNRHRSDLDETVTQSRLLLPTSFLLPPPTGAARILFIMCQIYVEYFQFGSRCRRSQGGILFTQENWKCEASETFKMRQFTRHSTISQTVYHTANEEEEDTAKKIHSTCEGSGKMGERERGKEGMRKKSQKSVRKPGKCLHKLRCPTTLLLQLADIFERLPYWKINQLPCASDIDRYR